MTTNKLPEIIAEVGVNFYDIANQKGISPLRAAQEMVKAAKDAGVSIVKFQTYKAERLAAKNSPSYWDLNEEPTTSQRELFSKYDKLSYNDFQDIAEYCSNIDVEFLSTSFDRESAIEINKIAKRHKIASADITNIELLSLIGSFKKPVLLSVGGATKKEVEKAVNILNKNGSTNVTLLHCVLNYPTSIEKANLWKIQEIKKIFKNIRVGYSDHTKFNISILEAAWLLGAEVIEKHYTLDKELKGNDHYHAAAPDDFKKLINHLKITANAIGEKRENWYDISEEGARINARRGVYLNKDVKAGDLIKLEDVDFLRPQGSGIDPIEFYSRVERGLAYTEKLKKGEQIKQNL